MEEKKKQCLCDAACGVYMQQVQTATDSTGGRFLINLKIY